MCNLREGFLWSSVIAVVGFLFWRKERKAQKEYDHKIEFLKRLVENIWWYLDHMQSIQDSKTVFWIINKKSLSEQWRIENQKAVLPAYYKWHNTLSEYHNKVSSAYTKNQQKRFLSEKHRDQLELFITDLGKLNVIQKFYLQTYLDRCSKGTFLPTADEPNSNKRHEEDMLLHTDILDPEKWKIPLEIKRLKEEFEKLSTDIFNAL